MARRTFVLRIDEELMAEVFEELGTKSVEKAVKLAFEEVVRLGAARRVVELERKLSESIDDPEEERRRAWGG